MTINQERAWITWFHISTEFLNLTFSSKKKNIKGVDFIDTHIKLNIVSSITNSASNHTLILYDFRGRTDTQSLLIIDNILICKHLDRQDVNITLMNLLRWKIVNTVSRLRKCGHRKVNRAIERYLFCSSNASLFPSLCVKLMLSTMLNIHSCCSLKVET